MKTTQFFKIVILLFISIYSIFWISVGSYYSYPTPEDLDVVNLSIEHGIIGGAISMMNHFDGRYTTDVLHGINPLAFGYYYGHKMMPIITFSLFCISFYIFLSTIFYQQNRFVNLAFSVAIPSVFFSNLVISNALYWMISTFIYVYPIIFFFLFYAFYIKHVRTHRLIYLLLSQITLFLLIGCNELCIIVIGLYMIYQLYACRYHVYLKKINFSFLLIYVASTLLFVTSYGISNRLDLLDSGSVLLQDNLLSITKDWILNTSKTFFSIPFFCILILFTIRYSIVIRNYYYVILMTVCALLFSSIALIILVGYSGFPFRTMPFFISVISFLWIVLISKYKHFFSQFQIVFYICLLFSFVLMDNSINKIKEEYQSGVLDNYKKIMDKDWALMTQNVPENSLKRVSITNLENVLPESIGTHPIIYPNRKCNYWNFAYEKFFQLDEVRLEGDTTIYLSEKLNEIRL